MSHHPQTTAPEICLYFGSFNPLHIAHLQLVDYALAHIPCRELWLVLSPVNPLKEASAQLPFAWRADYILQAISQRPRVRLLLLEQSLPAPHYTIRTVQALRLLHPELRFSLFIGSDNLLQLQHWHAYQRLLDTLPLHVYPRPDYEVSQEHLSQYSGHITLHPQAPRSHLSSSLLRAAALAGEDRRGDTAVPERWEALCQELKRLQ